MASHENLPPLPQSEGSVEIQVLDGGSFTANYDVVHAKSPSRPFQCHSWVFYIHHKPGGRHMIWDVGLSADANNYTAFNVRHCVDLLSPVSARLSLPEQLRQRGLAPEELDTVLFSHHHWDHSRPVRGMFPKATGYFGPGTFAYCAPGQFHDEPYSAAGKGDAEFFHPEKAIEKCTEFEGEWRPFGPFEEAIDFLGDGSLWIIKAPGHMPGNLAAAARLANGEWVILASDCCHSKALLDGTAEFRTWKSDTGEVKSLHEDLCATKETVKKLRILERDYGAHIALAHDSTWMLAGTNKVLMSLLDDRMLDFVKNRLPIGGYP